MNAQVVLNCVVQSSGKYGRVHIRVAHVEPGPGVVLLELPHQIYAPGSVLPVGDDLFVVDLLVFRGEYVLADVTPAGQPEHQVLCPAHVLVLLVYVPQELGLDLQGVQRAAGSARDQLTGGQGNGTVPLRLRQFARRPDRRNVGK